MLAGDTGPRVSAIIPAYDAESFIHEAIESVLAQERPVAECIVVDDGSTDNTARRVEEFGSAVTLVRQENRGVSAARNRGVAESTGELLAFLDADDRWRPGRIRLQVEALEREPEAEAVLCATQVVDRDLAPVGVLRQNQRVTAEDMLLCQADLVSPSSNLLIHRRVLEVIGGFDERLSTSADWALNLRLVERGRLIVLDEPLVEYRLHDANMSSSVDGFEADMLAAYDEVFADPTGPEARLKRRAYANLHRMIAGSYFVEGRVRPFIRHAGRSISQHPSTLPYFLGMPFRRLARRGRGPTASAR